MLELDPDLNDGIVTVDISTHTIRVRVHSGDKMTSRHPIVALLNSGSPPSFISEAARKRVVDSGAGDKFLECCTPPRVWGRFGNPKFASGPNFRAAISLPFPWSCRSTLSPTAYAVPSSDEERYLDECPFPLDHTLLRSTSRDPLWGELSLQHFDQTKASAFILHLHALSCSNRFRLIHGGHDHVDLWETPQIAPVSSVGSLEIPSSVGRFLVEILPESDVIASEWYFVCDGRQQIPLVGWGVL